MSAVDTARPSYAEASRTLLRQRVLDAVGERLGEKPWAEVTMAEVAVAAGVSRQTLYNEFGSRGELARAYVMREAETFVAAVEGAVVGRSDDPRAALAAAFELFLSAAATHPIVRAISAGEEGDELLALVTTRGGRLLEEITDRLTGFLATNWPRVDVDELRLVAETLIRLAISHAALPSAEPARTADSVARLLGPYLDKLVASD